MINEIKKLENISRALEPNVNIRQQLLDHVNEYVQKYIESIAHSPAYITHPDNGKALLDSPITDEGITSDEVLSLLHQNVSSLGVNLTSGRYLGYIPGGGLFHSALGDYLAAITNRYAGLFFISPGAVRVENMLLRWIASEIGYPITAAGNLTSGGSLANLASVVTARDSFSISGDAQEYVIYFTEHTHHSIIKALHVAGLGQCVKRQIRMDAHYRMDACALEDTILADQKARLKPWLVVASAGTIQTGSIDPLSIIGDIASKYGLWFHTDGAYGGLFVLCPEGKAALRDIHQSDSIVVDPHKSLFLPYGTGAVLIREGSKLYTAFNAEATYIQSILDEADELSPANLSMELTKHFRGLRLWLPLKLLGVAPFRAALSEKIKLAKYFYEQMSMEAGFELGPAPDLSIVIYRYLPKHGDVDSFNKRLLQEIQRDGRIFVSSTNVNGKLFLRAAILGYRTHLDEILIALDVLKQKVKRLLQE